MYLRTATGKTFEGETFHIEYVIKVDKQNLGYSDIDIYVNGELVGSLSYISGAYLTKLSHVVFTMDRGHEDVSSSLGAGNLLITGCK